MCCWLLVLLAVYFFMRQQQNKEAPSTDTILSVADLDNPEAEIGSDTSDATVDTLSKELKTKIDQQVAAKENPYTTVRTLIGVLCSTANSDRPMQCIDYTKSFLDKNMDILRFPGEEYGDPANLRMTYWRAEMYATLAYQYEFIVNNQFTDTDGKPLATVNDILTYINLYLEIAQNPVNWGEPQTAEETGAIWYLYDYRNTEYFVQWREQLTQGGVS